MSVTVEDLRPKNFNINVKGVELSCKPLKLHHALAIAKVGDVFSNPSKYNLEQIKNAESDMNSVISDILPELAGIDLDMSSTIQILEQVMDTIQPSDNKELSDSGVKFDTEKKV